MSHYLITVKYLKWIVIVFMLYVLHYNKTVTRCTHVCDVNVLSMLGDSDCCTDINYIIRYCCSMQIAIIILDEVHVPSHTCHLHIQIKHLHFLHSRTHFSFKLALSSLWNIFKYNNYKLILQISSVSMRILCTQT
jgi:hypothetical protein